MQLSPLIMATTSAQRHRWTYDVFVSFRGEDIRKNFMDHLFKDFEQKGIHAFRDDKDLTLGENISPNLDKVIQESRFLIVIFSINYAFSKWCLRELVKILECKQMGGLKHEVRTIFYDVKPDVVRNQTGSYTEAFAKHEISNRTEATKWKEVLCMAANLSGWDLQDMTNGYESKFIDRISKGILKALCHEPLHVGENLVGVDARVNEMNLLRFVGSSKVHMIGICGISGIGKTTLAKAIYNSMSIYFEKCSFCEDVQGVSKQQGLPQVQMQLTSKIMKTRVAEIWNVSEGIEVIKQSIRAKPILLVLDDVDQQEQLEALAGSRDWFFPGSLVIFTGKDKQLLRSHKVDEIHDMSFLPYYEAYELFSLYAFGEKHPTKGIKKLSYQVVDCLQGHPLALKVLGCFLYDKPMDVWKSELAELGMYSDVEIQQKLRPSFDGLDLNRRRTFLDIAFSFIGEDKDFVASVLGRDDSFAYADMEVLVNKSLITISEDDNSIQMHSLIQSMAKRIILEELEVKKVGSRLWNLSVVSNVLRKNEAIEAVEVLDLFLNKSSQNVHIDGEAFEDMKSLQILKIYDVGLQKSLKDSKVNYSGRLKSLSNKLRLLYWHGCPFEFPSDFYPENIVAIDLSYSHIKTLWTTPKRFGRLKVIKLRHCRNLTSTPDFTWITNLEELVLEGCVNLIKFHPSFGMLKRLVVLNMRGCKRFRRFPRKFKMDSLEVIILSGCSKVDKLPEFFGTTQTLMEFCIDGTAIKELSSFVYSQCKLQVLKSCRREENRSSLAGLRFLQQLHLGDYNIPDSIGIGGLSCLASLVLRGNNFTSLPGCLSQLSRLHSLRFYGCQKLEVLPELPTNLHELHAFNCTSLYQLSPNNDHKISSSFGMILYSCPKLFRNLSIESQVCVSQPLPDLNSSITTHSCRNQISSLFQFMEFPSSAHGIFDEQSHYLRRSKCLDIIYHGNRIPKWFTNTSMGNHIQVQLPPNFCDNKLRGYGICFVFTPKKSYCRNVYHVENFDGTSFLEPYPFYFHDIGIHKSDVIWFCFSTSIDYEWREAKNFVTFSIEVNDDDVEVKECGVRLVFDEDLGKEMDFSISQDLPTPTQDGGAIRLMRNNQFVYRSW